MTLEDMTSAIRTNVGTGLKEVSNYPFSLEQIKDEISNMRSSIIYQLSSRGQLNPSYFSQSRKNIELSVSTFPEEGVLESSDAVFFAKIPKLAMTKDNSSVLYLGPTDMSLNLKTYYSFNALKTHQYSRVIKNRPYAFIDLSQDDNGFVPVYITNIGPFIFKNITIRAIFDDPVKILQEDGYFVDTEEFPAPLTVQEMIVDSISKKYITYYRSLSTPNKPNDQTDNN